MQQCSGTLVFENCKYSDNVDYRRRINQLGKLCSGCCLCRKLAEELGFKQTKPTILWEHNNCCLSLVKSGHYKGRNKHFEIRYCFQFINDYIDRGLLELRLVDSKDHLTDLGTTPTPCPQLQRMRPTLYGGVRSRSL